MTGRLDAQVAQIAALSALQTWEGCPFDLWLYGSLLCSVILVAFLSVPKALLRQQHHFLYLDSAPSHKAIILIRS